MEMEDISGPYNPTMNLVIGCSIALLTSCLTSLAVNLQASALQQERILNNLSEQDPQEWLPDRWTQHQVEGQMNEIEEESETSTPEETILQQVTELCTSKDQRHELYIKTQWYIGFILYILCQIFGSVLALGYISPMVLAPLGSLGLIFNIIFSSIFSGTLISNMDWIGTCLIVVGCAIISAFGTNIPEPHQTIPELIQGFTRPAFIAYLSVEIAVIVLIFSLIKYLEYNIEYLKDSISRSVSRRTSRLSASDRSQGHFSDDSEHTTSPIDIEVPFVTDREITRDVSHGSLVRFADEQHYDSESSPLITRTSTVLSIRTVNRGRMSWLLGILYSCVGGIVASVTLLLTKSGYHQT
jgi:drug/metabolite transporter superfamily protein YnfA/heme exporter protein D